MNSTVRVYVTQSAKRTLPEYPEYNYSIKICSDTSLAYHNHMCLADHNHTTLATPLVPKCYVLTAI